jgi:hypothetical protein
MSWEYQVSSESLKEKQDSNGYSRIVLLFGIILCGLAVGGFFGA